MSAAAQAPRLRVLVIDDEPLARANLTVLLSGDADIDLLPDCESGAEALQRIRTERPDLVFMDVQMPECDGFDVLEMLGSEMPPAIIFVTAFDRYAIRAFEVAALDFLLKPFDDDRFAKALARAKDKVRMHRLVPAKSQILAVKSIGKVILIATDEIDWIEAENYYSALHVGEKTHLIRRSMNELDRTLDEKLFCRVHRNAIVNLRRVQEISFGGDGAPEVVLRTGKRIRLSRRYRDLLSARIA